MLVNYCCHGAFTKARLGICALLALGCLPLAAGAVTITWDAGGDETNWSDAANWTAASPNDNTAPGSSDVAAFGDIAASVTTVVDSTFGGTIQAIRINQTTTTATNTITLGKDLILSNNGAFQFNSTSSGGTLAQASMFVLDPGGNDVVLSSTTAANVQTFFGTYRLDDNGSDIYSNWSIGTSGDNSLTFNIGTTSPAAVNASGSGVLVRIGHIRSLAGSTNNSRPFTVNLGVTSTTAVSDGAHLAFVRDARSDSHTFTVINAGTIEVDSASRLSFSTDSGNSSTGTHTVNITNEPTGVITQAGEFSFQRLKTGGSGAANGTISFENTGKWVVSGTSAALNLRLRNSAATVTLNLSSSGTLTGATTNDVLEYTRYETTTLGGTTATASGRALLTSSGIISPGDEHNGAGLSSVGSLVLRDLNVTLTGASSGLRIDIGGTTAGSYDTLTLATGLTAASGAGTLTIDSANSDLAIYFVNGFVPAANSSWDIAVAGLLDGNFITTNLTIQNAVGSVADPSSYTITEVDGTTVRLTYVPEPASLTLLALTGTGFLRRRRSRSTAETPRNVH